MIVELVGLEVFGRHGVDDDERETGRTFYYDIALTVDEPREDRLEATVDYRAVAACVREVSDAGEYSADREAGRGGGGRARRPLPREARGGSCAEAGNRAVRAGRRVLRRYRSARELICTAYRAERTPLAGKTSR